VNVAITIGRILKAKERRVGICDRNKVV